MYRQSPSRNQRSKGIRVKHVLQICLLIAVSFWLIYQVKHSHDKKKEFDESDAKALTDGANSDDLIKLGRKDIRPRVEETISKNEKHDGTADEDETIGEEVEENRIEEDEPEDKKVEVKEDKEMGAGDDETDEHEEEKSDAEVNKEEDAVEADKEEEAVEDEEREGGDEIETQETDSEDGQSQSEKESLKEDTDNDGDDRSTHEAREEHYKADDASSAVTHDTPIVTSGNESELSETSNEDRGNIEVEKKENNGEENTEGEMRKDLEAGGEILRDDHQSNVTTSETKVEGLSTNNTVTDGSNYQTSNTSPEVIVETHDDLPSQNVTEGTNNSFVNVNSNRLDSDSTETKDAEPHSSELSNSSNNSTDSSASENITRSVEEGNIDDSNSEKNDGTQDVKSDESDGTYETTESTVTEDPEEVQHEAIDISDASNSTEETNVRVDLDTLPQIQTEGIDNDDAAAE